MGRPPHRRLRRLCFILAEPLTGRSLLYRVTPQLPFPLVREYPMRGLGAFQQMTGRWR